LGVNSEIIAVHTTTSIALAKNLSSHLHINALALFKNTSIVQVLIQLFENILDLLKRYPLKETPAVINKCFQHRVASSEFIMKETTLRASNSTTTTKQKAYGYEVQPIP
jgi:hypothetical protein